MKVTLLGTGSPLPDPHRAGPATLVEAAGARVLVDCGRGVVMRLAAAGALPPLLDAVALTHLHSDHVGDLGDVLTTHWVMRPDPAPLRVLGPARTDEVVAGTLAALAPDIGYRLAHHADLTAPPAVDLTTVAAGDVVELGALTVRVGATDHRPVEPTVAYRLEAEGRAVVLGGDGVPCAGLDEICAGADAYVQTVVRDDLVRLVPSARFRDILDYHSTVEQAAQTARRAGVHTLVLTHLVPAPAPGTEEEWRARAAAHFGGTVVMGDDLTVVEI